MPMRNRHPQPCHWLEAAYDYFILAAFTGSLVVFLLALSGYGAVSSLPVPLVNVSSKSTPASSPLVMALPDDHAPFAQSVPTFPSPPMQWQAEPVAPHISPALGSPTPAPDLQLPFNVDALDSLFQLAQDDLVSDSVAK
ncbi:hypothetical protein CYLTODRAFT_417866 [Cylindrobasidium torrendii FP15055 ss-10]|uniref:Uncharacterized protein n=1 Tax=Cylindrobasidium torrendii FP15055 ss-10 TaxID=1314674 RepID=A0A0D7BQF8_9AGAR|nr:hypothetical protein CYLTODRAFT_417866 [Cylindrobasidium torrendii FP15055 ss-10]